jgi:hypothetical protein
MENTQSHVVNCNTCFSWNWSRTKVETNVLDTSIHGSEHNLVQNTDKNLENNEVSNTISPNSDDDVIRDIAKPNLQNPVCFDWETSFFSGFDWMDENMEKYIISENLIKYIDHLDIETDLALPLHLYFVSLENNKMFLYHCEESPEYKVVEECAALCEYTKINPPIKVVFSIPNIRIEEVDENVKLFMHEFGIENTRGGSYTDVEILDSIARDLHIEFATYPSKHN